MVFGKKAIRRVKKIGNAHIFEAVVTRRAAHRRLIDELLDFFGGSSQRVVAHLIESGNLTLADVKEAKQTLKRLRADKTKGEVDDDCRPRDRSSSAGRTLLGRGPIPLNNQL